MNNFRGVTNPRNIHRGGIKIKNIYILCLHIFFHAYKKIENPNILDRHPVKILPLENLSKPTRINL